VGTAASITATAGTPQSALVGAPFATALQATVKDGGGNPLSGVTVTFSAPTSGASATLSGATAITNGSGVASVTATANATAGGPYNVSASVAGVAATFALTNTASAGPPATVSVTPSSGVGSAQPFTFVFSDPNGAGYLSAVYMLFNQVAVSTNGCYVRYTASTGMFALLSNNGSSWGSGGKAGGSATLSNGQCAISLSGATVTASGDTLTVALSVSFSGSFDGGKQIWLYALDAAGRSAGLNDVGTWMVGSVAEAPPSAVSVTPSAGYGTAQKFTFVAADPNGAGDLEHVYMLFNQVLVSPGGCYVRYDPYSNLLYLLSDNGSAWGTGAAPGATATLSNSQCAVNLTGSTVTASGATLSIALNLSFSGGFAGGKQMWLYAQDGFGEQAGWNDVGSWMVGSGASAAPSAVSVTPSSGYGTAQPFTFVVADPNGAGDLAHVYILWNQVLQAANGCEVRYDPSSNLLYLLSNNGSAWGTGMAPGATATLSNSQCTLNLSGAAVTASGTTLTIALNASFSGSFAGGKQMWLYAVNGYGQNTGWVDVGTWTVGSMASAPPSAVSVTPSSGVGTAQQFTFVAADPGGAGDLEHVYMLFNQALVSPGGCYVRYDPYSNLLYLLSDNGSAWGTGAAPGATATLSNSQCTLNLSAATATASGTTLTIVLNASFSGSFDGGKQVWLYAVNGLGQNTGWVDVGTWMVGSMAEVAPSVGALSEPAGDAGTGGQFQFGFSDGNGSGDIAAAYMVFNTTLSAAHACEVEYVAWSGLLYLLADNAASWAGSVQPGVGGTVSNSQCTLTGAGSTVTGSGDNLTVTLNLTFAGGFAGSQQVWGYVQDGFGEHAGWTRVGTWTVP
jgi:uncharacterized protein YuzE